MKDKDNIAKRHKPLEDKREKEQVKQFLNAGCTTWQIRWSSELRNEKRTK